MLGVIIGFTTMVCVINFGLINIFKIYPIIQEILKITGSVFLIYLAYKIAFASRPWILIHDYLLIRGQ